MNKQDALKRAIDDFKQLVIYFDVTRPQHEKNYFKDGKFNRTKMIDQHKFLDSWNSKSRSDKKSLSKVYSKYSETFNLTFGIPRELISSIIGSYRDDDGKKHRILIGDVICPLVEKNFIKVVNDGKKFNKDDDGNYKVKCWWNKKYLLKNDKYWFKLLSDPKYSNIETFASKRVRNIVFNWISKFKKKHENVESTNNVEQQKQISETKKDKQMINGEQKKTITSKVIQSCLKRGVISPETAVQWIGDLVYFRKQNPFTIDEATMLYNSEPTMDKNNYVDKILDFLKENGFLESDALHLLISGIKN